MRKPLLLVTAVLLLRLGAPFALGAPSTCSDSSPPSSLTWTQALTQARDTSITAFNAIVLGGGDTPLSVRVYLPDAFSGPLPTILWITPYVDPSMEEMGLATIADCAISFFLRRGYAFALAAARGSLNSGGCDDAGGPLEQADGKALVDWIAEQMWSDQSVGVRGLSVEGRSAYATAIAQPAALKAVAAASPTNNYDNLYYGAVPWEHRWVYPVFDAQREIRPQGLCPETQPLSLDGTKTAYWQERDMPELAQSIRVPVLHTHGTGGVGPEFDSTWEFQPYWEGLGQAGVPRKAYVGPWPHGWPNLDGWSYYELRWFEHWLKGIDTGMLVEPSLTLIGNDGTTRTSNVYPPGTTTTLAIGARRLAPDAPSGEAKYTDVPELPRPLIRSAAGARLLYVGDALGSPLRISGDSTLELTASIDRTSTHFVARLYDAAPDGAAKTITFGYLDAQHRRTLDQAEPVTPGIAQEYDIRLYGPEYVVPAGHHLELVVASSDACLGASASIAQFALAMVGSNDAAANLTGDCRVPGVISDTSVATVTVDEVHSRLQLATAAP